MPAMIMLFCGPQRSTITICLIYNFKVSDEVYEELEKQDLDNAFDPSRPRPYRTIEEMATESTVLRLELYALLKSYMLISANITI